MPHQTPKPDHFDSRITERRNQETTNIDVATSLEIVELLNAEDRKVPVAVFETREVLARVIDMVVSAFIHGGRLIYVGAGTSGRLGVLDAAECPPTFGSPPEMVSGVIAGGAEALMKSQEGAEDDVDAGRQSIDERGVTRRDVVVGIAASGTTPYVNAALSRAQQVGAKTVLLSCTDPPQSLASSCDEVIVARVGPEALTGSTRLKAGTATKLILNTITTGAMVRAGKAYGNLMVDLKTLSEKLQDRGERIVMEVCGIDREGARAAIEAAGGSVKVALVMERAGLQAEEARERLDAADGLVRRVLGDPPPVLPQNV